MKLMRVIEIYVKFKQAMGMSFQTSAATLKAYGRSQGNIEIHHVSPKSVLAFLNGNGALTRTWHHKFSALRVFYRFAISRGYAQISPLPTTLPKQPPAHVPYIYTRDELHRLLDATSLLIDRRRSLPQPTLRLLLLFLYGTGLRLKEALTLSCNDVDLSSNLLTIHCSKFYKSRFVPFGNQLHSLLESYLAQRQRLPMPKGMDSTYFATNRGAPIGKRCIELNFQRLCYLTDIHRSDSTNRQPCLHDLRHTFAVHRLTLWYRSNTDVQRSLPHLSTYLGHVRLASTQRYLNMTQDLLREANNRFELYALPEVCHAK